MTISIFDISSYLPENRVSADYFAQVCWTRWTFC
ncbi:Putative 3-oxoacyl-ACP synthase III [Mycobacteroides abscessus subsp. massiliense]|nr:Putative 3-oxoacyl-ACP synthase III [Mycobacteroides abscessus subsp. massiliense]